MTPARSAGSGGRYGASLSALLILPLLILLAGVFFYPVLKLLAGSFFQPDFTLANYERLIAEPLYLRVLLRTLWIATAVTGLAFLLGYPVALLMARLNGWTAGLVTACVLVPLWTSVLVRSYAWIVLLQRTGIVNSTLIGLGVIDEPLRLIYTEGAVLVAMTHVLLPFMILPIYAALKNISPDLERAALSLGSSRFTAFREVTLPLSAPGVASGVLMTFILALGFYVTPALVGGPRTLMMGTLIGQQVTELLNWSFAGALATVLLLMTLGAAVIFRRLIGVERMTSHG